MRRLFCAEATALLDALALAPTPAYCVAWPVHRQRIALPSSQQIARAMKPIGARLDGQVRQVNDNEALLRSLHGPDLWTAMPRQSSRQRQTSCFKHTARGIARHSLQSDSCPL